MGLSVGAFVGLSVGARVGFFVGATVGFFVGEDVGDFEGDKDGLCVGTIAGKGSSFGSGHPTESVTLTVGPGFPCPQSPSKGVTSSS